MEEEKAAAYYDELTRKGEGAARFKQGLGFSSNNNPPPLGSALVSSSSFLSNFVKASNSQTNKNDTNDNNNNNKQKPAAALETIQSKLKNKSSSSSSFSARFSERTHHRHRSPSRERERDRERSRRHLSRSRSREKQRRSRSRERRSNRRRRKSRSRSGSPRRRREREERGGKERLDYAKFIQGYDQMTPAERVKAKMKLQLNETAKKDVAIGTGTAWERFEFDKDAPLDDEEVEAADDDAALVKHIGKSFRFSTVEAQRNEQIKVAHDEAMFGTPALLPSTVADAIAGSEPDFEDDKKESTESIPQTNLLSEKVLGKQKGSWRDRARKVMDGRSTS